MQLLAESQYEEASQAPNHISNLLPLSKVHRS